MSLDTATVRRIARLARIRIEEEERPRLQREMNSILGWIDLLNELDVDGVPPMVGAEQSALRLRSDIVDAGNMPETVLGNAPGRHGAFYAVPKVVE